MRVLFYSLLLSSLSSLLLVAASLLLNRHLASINRYFGDRLVDGERIIPYGME